MAFFFRAPGSRVGRFRVVLASWGVAVSMKFVGLSLLFSVLAYLLGAIPFGLLIGKARGVDVRTVGSGNIGATNVFRTVGKPWGVLTFVLDLAKGFIAAYGFPLVVGHAAGMLGNLPALKVLYGVYAVAGHNWPVYLGFKGGKGVATTAGVLLGLAPMGAAVGLVVWIVALVASRYVSVASMTAAVAVPAAAWYLYFEDFYLMRPIVLTMLGVVVVWRHKSNILRLRNGTESRFSFRKDER